MTVNAFVAGSGVIMPVDMTDEGALQGAVEVRAIVRRLARADDVAVRALIRTKVDRRRIVYHQMSAALGEPGLPVARTEIPMAAAFQNAAAERLPLLSWRSTSPGADAYRALAVDAAPSEGCRMNAQRRRRLASIDDPCESPRAPRAPRQAAPFSEQMPALFVRLPTEQADALARAAFELRAHKRELVSALLARYVDPYSEEGSRRCANCSPITVDLRDSRQPV